MSAPRALVRVVSSRLDAAELTFLDRAPVDLERAVQQHAAYVELLRALGHEVVHAPAADELPDGTFVEDAVVVVDDLAVLTRPGASSRRPEVASVREALVGLGVPTASLTAPGTLDGGDVLQIGHTVFVGLGSRTDPAGAQQLQELVAPLGRTVVPVTVTGCLHLKTGATALPDGTVLAVRSWVDVRAFERAGLPVVAVPEPAGADVLLSGDRVVMSAAAPRTAELVADRGFPVHAIDLSELEKVEAGPTCLSVLLPPEP